MNLACVIIEIVLFSQLIIFVCEKPKSTIEQLENVDQLKKIFRTKKNVLVLYKFASFGNGYNPVVKLFTEIADSLFGKATLAIVNCESEIGRKTCKKMKLSNAQKPYLLYHYNNGQFNKEYDRRLNEASIKRFLADPTSELPWEEEPDSKDVFHVPDAKTWKQTLKTKDSPILAMFYAPWCGYCKKIKPDFGAAATELKSKAILAALDVTRPELYEFQAVYNVTGFPTILYFENHKLKFPYSGQHTKDGIISWMKSPIESGTKTVGAVEEISWSDEKTDVFHLNDENFDTFLKEHSSVLVMFYAPWCGHCKAMKPTYAEVAKILKDENSNGVLAAFDASKEKKIAEKFDIKGFPTVKYFQNGSFKWDFNDRTKESILAFMKDPKEPPPPPPPEVPWSEEDNEVVHLTSENFKTELKKRKHALVMFYAPWCGHCKQAKPEFTMAASRFKEDFKVMFSAVDCTLTENQAICKAHDVQGFPTIKYFNYFRHSEPYYGGRLAADFIGYIEAQNGPGPAETPAPPARMPGEEAFPEIFTPVDGEDDTSDMESWGDVVELTDENYDAVMGKYDRVLVMFHSPDCRFCKEDKPEYKAAAARINRRRTDVALAAMDCSNYNGKCWDFRVAGYPSLFLFEKTRYLDIHHGYPNRENLARTVLKHLIEKQAQPKAPASSDKASKKKSEL